MDAEEKPPLPVPQGKRPGLPPLLLRRNTFAHLWYVAWSLLMTGVIVTVTLAVRWPLGVNPLYITLVFGGVLGTARPVEEYLALYKRKYHKLLAVQAFIPRFLKGAGHP